MQVFQFSYLVFKISFQLEPSVSLDGGWNKSFLKLPFVREFQLEKIFEMLI